VLLLVVLTSVTLITLDRRSDDDGPLGAVGRGAHTVVGPVGEAVGSVADPVGDWISGVTSARSLRRENDELRERVEELEGELRAGQSALEENQQLKELLQLPLTSELATIAARVVASSPGNFERTITLDKGSDAGIVPDMPVIGAAGLVGRVLEVWSNGSKVLLLTDERSGVGVRVVPERVTGVAEGRAGSDSLRLDITDARARLATGDAIETSGLEGSAFPPNLPVGEIESVAVEAGGTGQRVRVRPYVDFERLEFVLVLKWVPGQGPVVTSTTTSTTTTSTVPGATTSTTGPVA
jgi:rod shape-determining protein MreC